VDVLYEHRVRLVCSAAVEPLELFAHVLTQAEMRERSQGGQARALPRPAAGRRRA
jgi:predicted ATPase